MPLQQAHVDFSPSSPYLIDKSLAIGEQRRVNSRYTVFVCIAYVGGMQLACYHQMGLISRWDAIGMFSGGDCVTNSLSRKSRQLAIKDRFGFICLNP